jgi:hypothetical protein
MQYKFHQMILIKTVEAIAGIISHRTSNKTCEQWCIEEEYGLDQNPAACAIWNQQYATFTYTSATQTK